MLGHIAKSPLVIEGNAKHNTDDDGIYHRTKSLVKVNAQLVKAFNIKASFIPCNRAVEILFYAKHPFVTHYILPQSWGELEPKYRYEIEYHILPASL